MYRIVVVSVFSALLIGCASSSRDPSSLSSAEICDNLPGVWVGSHEPKSSDVFISYKVELEAGGRFMAYLTNISASAHKRQETQIGVWSCKDDVFSTVSRSSLGKDLAFRYRVLEMTRSYMKYQNFSDKKPGPIFEADRVDNKL